MASLTSLNPSAFGKDVDLVLEFADDRICQRILTHGKQGGRIEVECDEVGAMRLVVGELMNIQVLCRAGETFAQPASANRKHLAFLGHVKDRLGCLTTDNTHGTGRIAVIVDGAALSIAPAENQCVVGGTLVHEVAPI